MDVIEAMETCSAARYLRPDPVPQDLIEFARMPSMTHTFGQLARLGMIHG